jgi:hypothetical protein
MSKKQILWLVLGVSVVGIAYFVYRRRNKPKNTGETTNDVGILESIFDLNDSEYKSISDKIESAKKNVLSFYEKNGNVLRDLKTGKSISLDATKSAYFMVTKEIVKERNAVMSSYASNQKKNEVKSLVDSYLNSYLPKYFDQNTYNINAIWYKNILAKL